MENDKNKLFLTVVLTIFLIMLAGGIGYLLYQNQQLKNQAYQISSDEDTLPSETTPSPTAQPTIPGDSYTENTNVTNQKKYVSPQLGISFLYLSLNQGSNFKVKEVANKVYIYDLNYDYDSGQYVEVFTKDSDQTLKQAIEEMFLEGYSTSDCLATSSPASEEYPSTYIEGNIIVPGEFTDMEEMAAKWQLCPQPYVRTNGISYFLMDGNKPDKFVFFSIGQYAILAGTGDLAWQDTIVFLD